MTWFQLRTWRPHMVEPRVIVVDDQAIVRKSIRNVLEFSDFDVTAYDSAEQFLDSEDVEQPGCLVLDLKLEHGMSGLQLLERLDKAQHPMPVVLMSAYATVSDTVTAMKHGAIDVLQKPFRTETLIKSVKEALAISEEQQHKLQHSLDFRRRLNRLSKREHEVFELLLEGKDYKEIAVILDISPKTVSIHRGNVLNKLGAKNVAEASKMMHDYNDGK